jgi:predicted nucleotidyltransferase
MNPEPRHQEDYAPRQVEAAKRVLIDVGQILASFADCLVVVGGWAPDLLLTEAAEAHTGSIDVDLALDVERLGDGRYASLLKLLLDTQRYRKGVKPFQLITDVDLKDGEKAIQVELDFLAPESAQLEKNHPKLIEDFRILKVDGSEVAFQNPVNLTIPGRNVVGARNSVQLRVVSLPDFIIMKAHALRGREKPKDAYDICYCLENYPGGLEALASNWKSRLGEKAVTTAVAILEEKFEGVDFLGPALYVEFYSSTDAEEQAMQARRAYELVHRLLSLLH